MGNVKGALWQRNYASMRSLPFASSKRHNQEVLGRLTRLSADALKRFDNRERGHTWAAPLLREHVRAWGWDLGILSPLGKWVT